MKRKKLTNIILSGILAVGMLAGCASENADSAGANSKVETAGDSVGVSGTGGKTDESLTKTGLNEEEEITLHLFGPGLLAAQGKTGTLDMITGLETPGYEVIEARWNELHPNVHLEMKVRPGIIGSPQCRQRLWEENLMLSCMVQR